MQQTMHRTILKMLHRQKLQQRYDLLHFLVYIEQHMNSVGLDCRVLNKTSKRNNEKKQLRSITDHSVETSNYIINCFVGQNNVFGLFLDLSLFTYCYWISQIREILKRKFINYLFVVQMSNQVTLQKSIPPSLQTQGQHVNSVGLDCRVLNKTNKRKKKKTRSTADHSIETTNK